MDVPLEMQEIHTAFLIASGDCRQAANRVASNTDNYSPDDYKKAIELLQTCEDELATATQLLKEYLTQFGEQ
jgi:hypothetical protein